jgi:hypothetical protein
VKNKFRIRKHLEDREHMKKCLFPPRLRSRAARIDTIESLLRVNNCDNSWQTVKKKKKAHHICFRKKKTELVDDLLFEIVLGD